MSLWRERSRRVQISVYHGSAGLLMPWREGKAYLSKPIMSPIVPTVRSTMFNQVPPILQRVPGFEKVKVQCQETWSAGNQMCPAKGNNVAYCLPAKACSAKGYRRCRSLKIELRLERVVVEGIIPSPYRVESSSST